MNVKSPQVLHRIKAYGRKIVSIPQSDTFTLLQQQTVSLTQNETTLQRIKRERGGCLTTGFDLSGDS